MPEAADIDSPKAHGEPLGVEELRLTKAFFGFSPDESFVVPDGVRQHFAAGIGARGTAERGAWDRQFAPPSIGARVTVEEALPIGWDRYAGRTGILPGMHSFGMPAPIAVAAEHFGFTAERVYDAAKRAFAANPKETN
jgi:transketolase